MLRSISIGLFFLICHVVGWAQSFPTETLVCREGAFTLESPLGGVWLYQWERSFDGGTSWSVVNGATTANLLINTPTTGISYRLRYALSPTCLADPACANFTNATRIRLEIPLLYQTAVICQGDTVRVGGDLLTTPGTHLTRINNGNCDSLVSTFVLIHPSYNQLQSVTLCPGETFEGEIYNAPTNFTRILTASTGCDSIVHYEIRPSFPPDLAIEGPSVICAGESATLSVAGVYPSMRWSNGEENSRSINVSQATTYTLTLTNSSGCQITLQHPLELVSIRAEPSSQPAICPGSPTGQISLQASGDEMLLYSFDGGLTFSSNSIATNLLPATYELVVESPLGCQWSGRATVADAPPLRVFTNQPSEISIERGDSLNINIQTNFPAESFQWNTRFGLSCDDCPNPTATPLANVNYTVLVAAPGGCTLDTTLHITVLDNRRYYAPNAFAPSGRSENQVWKIFPGPRTAAIEGLTILDRWGGTLYRQAEALPINDPRLAWDGSSQGQPLPAGTYTYAARLHFTDGSFRMASGTINLIR